MSANTFCCCFKTKLEEKRQGSKTLLLSFLVDTTTKKLQLTVIFGFYLPVYPMKRTKHFKFLFPLDFNEVHLIFFRWVYPAGYTKSVKGDIVLITGGGSGIGRLMSLKLADLGAIIVTWDVNAKGNEETVR